MVSEQRWAEIRRLRDRERLPVSAIARRLELDRKTVRKYLRLPSWVPYRRSPAESTLLTAHAEWLRGRAPQVDYSAQVLYQELQQQRQYRGSYETVKRFVAPLRELAEQAGLCQRRFETPPGQQSQVDWGQLRVPFRSRPQPVHVFVLTLGFSRRSFYQGYVNERLPHLLEAHELAFAHFGGLCREHLYDRMRTVSLGEREGRVLWHPTFQAFAAYWGFEPRLCRPYRAQTKGKVESGVKYLRRNFLPGRAFVDLADFHEQLAEWTATIADQRIHGTTHERPSERFQQEQPHLLPLGQQTHFALEARVQRVVADDYLVSFETNRYSVPFTLIGQTVELERRGALLVIWHRGQAVAQHPLEPGRHQVRLLPEHGPGAIARTQRRPRPGGPAAHRWAGPEEVEIRDLALYEQLAAPAVVAA
jgi:transposase